MTEPVEVKMAEAVPLLEVRGMRKTYTTLTALGGVDLTVTEGSFHGLIGPNGSGKTTLLKCITGAEQPAAGIVYLAGRDVTQSSPVDRVRAGMSMKFQITSVLAQLSVYDNVLAALQASDSVLALVFSRTRKALHTAVLELLARYALERYRDEPAGSLSHGQQQWLELAMAMARRPRLLLLDEPTSGMNPEERYATGKLLEQIRDRSSLLIVEHDLDFIVDICDTLTVLDQGLVVETGRTAAVQVSEKVRGVYLG